MKRNEMKTHTFFNTIKYSAFLIAAFIFVSCQNGITEKNTTEKVSQKGRIVVSANATTVSREAANPDLSLSNFSDFKLYASTAALPANLESITPIASGNTVEDLNDPAIELDAGIWNFALSASLNGVSFSGTNNNFEVSSGSTNTISFTLTPDIDGGGLEVTITFPSEADKVHIKLEPAAGGSAVIDEDATTFETSGSQKSLTVSRNISNALERIAPGTYKLIYSFYVSDITDALNSCEFIVNIAAGITTSKTDFVISDLNETYGITYQYKYFTVGKESGESIDVSSLLTQDDETIVLPTKYFRKSNIENTDLPVLKNYTVDGKTYSFAGWYESSDLNHVYLTKYPSSDSDISLIACFTDTIYVSPSNTQAQHETVSGFYSIYPCYKLDSAIKSIKRFQMNKVTNADSNVDWKIIVDGQTTGANLSQISGKSLTLQGKTGSNTDILDGGNADLADYPDNLDVSAVLTVQTGFPVYISKLKLTHGGRAINLWSKNDSSPLPTELTLQSDTIIVNNFSGGDDGTIYLQGGSADANVILNIEDGVVISNNIARGDDSVGGMGGAIKAGSYSIINMSGGEISNNTAYNWGGGIYVFNNATLNLTGGTISGNNVSFLGTTPNSDGQKGGAIYKAAGGTINIKDQTYIPYADNKNDIYLAGGAINLSGEIDLSQANPVDQVYGITIADPTETNRTVLTETDAENGKYVSGFHEKFVATTVGYEIGSDGKWAPKTDTPYTVYHYKQPDNGSTTLTEYQLADTDDESGTTGSSTNATAKSYAGFTAQTFSQSTIAGDGSTEIYIYYDRDNITYTFNKATGEVWESDSETGTRSGLYETSFTPPTITRTGYNFDKWKTADDEELASPYTFGAQNKTYNASWTAKAYTIQYELDGGTNHADNPTTYSILSAITLKAPTKEGAVFDGWYTNAGFTTSITQIAIGTYQSGNTPLTLYAKWKYSTDINVSINTSSNSQLSMAVTIDGETVEAGQTISAKYSATTGKTIIFTPTLPESGYTCVWKVDEKSSMTGMSVNNTSKVLTIDTTGWLPGVYDVQLRASKDSTYESYYAQIKIQAFGSKLTPNAVGDIVFNDGTATAYSEGITLSDEQKAAAVSVIFYKGTECSNDSRQRILGLGLKNSDGDSTKTYYWASNDSISYSNIGISSLEEKPTDGTAYYQSESNEYYAGDFDGSDNWSEICAQDSTGTASEEAVAANYPAFNYVNNYASNSGLTGNYAIGWYMPTAVELHCIYKNITLLNTILGLLNNADTLALEGYWSSSQDASIYHSAHILTFSYGGIFQGAKSNTFRVCVIREF